VVCDGSRTRRLARDRRYRLGRDRGERLWECSTSSRHGDFDTRSVEAVDEARAVETAATLFGWIICGADGRVLGKVTRP
jgi:hypothetical protein